MINTCVPMWQHSNITLVSLVDFLSIIRGDQPPKQTLQRKVVNAGKNVSDVQCLAASIISDLIVLEKPSIHNFCSLLHEANRSKSISLLDSKRSFVKLGPNLSKTGLKNLGFTRISLRSRI